MSVKHVVLGTGPIARAVVNELRQRGEPVRMVNRSGRLQEIPAGVDVVAADLYDTHQVQEVTRGARVVYQCSQPEYHQWVEKFPALQNSILSALEGSQAKLVLVENLYMYGEVHNTPVNENMTHNAHTRKGKVRSLISKAAFEAHQAGRVRVTAARGSDFFGAWGLNTAAMGARTFYSMLSGGAANLIGNIDVPHTHTFIPDFGKALVILGERDEADGKPWHVPNDNPLVTQREMAKLIADTLNQPLRVNTMGKGMMRLGGLFIPAAKETVEMMYEFEKPFIVDSSRFEHAFGIKATPMALAIQETVAWYQSHPQK